MATQPKVTDLDYIQFLLAAQTTFSCVEAARTDGAPDDPPVHDAYCRLLTRQSPDTGALWSETEPFVNKQTGVLVVDDSTLDKPHARHMDLAPTLERQTQARGRRHQPGYSAVDQWRSQAPG